jgi:hypothetical protein
MQKYAYINITWIPKEPGLNIICSIGLTNLGFSTDQSCRTLAVGDVAPKPSNITAYPTGLVFSNQTVWSISADQELTSPSKNSLIKFYELDTNNLVYFVNVTNSDEATILNKTIKFTTKQFLENYKSYYINFDSGVFKSKVGCKLESEDLKDSRFCSFIVKIFIVIYS